MASRSAKKKRVSFSESPSASLQSSPNVSTSQVTIVEEHSFTQHLFNNSSLNSSYAEYTCDESFDLLPKTDYTYARSGSYSPRHLRGKYVNPNMSRRRLRGMVTPPVSMLEDSDSDDGLGNQMSVDQGVHMQQHMEASITSNQTSSNARVAANNTQSCERDELDFDSDDDMDSAVSEHVGNSSRVEQKELAEMENRMIQHSQHSTDSNYRNYDGMVLRSGSHLKGAKRFIEEHEHNRRKSTSAINARLQGKSADIESSNSASAVYDSRRKSDGTTRYTTVTKTVTETEEEAINMNNSAGKTASSEEVVNANNSARHNSRARRSYTRRYSAEDYNNEDKQARDEYQHEKDGRRLRHLYGLDHSDDFSDSDTYTTDSASASLVSDEYDGYKRGNFFARSFGRLGRKAKYLWYNAEHMSRRTGRWLWRRMVNFVAYFILADAWVLSRRAERGCCACLPCLLLLPLLLGSGYYGVQYLPSPSSIYSIFERDDRAHVHKMDSMQMMTLRQEVKHILNQLQSDHRQWLTKAEVEVLVQSILKPEMESLRVSLLNIANEGNYDQSAIKVDQQDTKQRLAVLEGQLAMLQARAKNLENDIVEGRTDMHERLVKSDESQAAAFAQMQAAILDIKGETEKLQLALDSHVASNKKCCMNESTVVAIIRANVNNIIAEMLDGKDQKGSGIFTGWLQRKFVDRGEFEQQIHTLTAEITDKISASMGSQRTSLGASIVLPGGGDTLSEEAVKLIVEDALMKYSADRTGLPDYALESAGGSVISVRCSETYYKKTALISVFGIPLWYTSNSPRTVIQPDVHPGQCWAFKGSSGYIVIQLSVPIRPTSFSLEHIPKSLSMTGSLDSAPKDFTVYGLASETDTQGVNLGNFTYLTVDKPIQTFDVQIRNPGVFGFVELRVLTNHGNKDYTCLYRVRVHGVPQS